MLEAGGLDAARAGDDEREADEQSGGAHGYFLPCSATVSAVAATGCEKLTFPLASS